GRWRLMCALGGLARPGGWWNWGGRACAAAAVHERIVSWDGLDGEKTWTVPNRAGNGPRDRRQAGIGGEQADRLGRGSQCGRDGDCGQETVQPNREDHSPLGPQPSP